MQLEHSLLLAAAPESVFAFLAEPRNLPEWVTAIVALEALPGAASGEGARFRQTIEASGRRMELAGHIVTARAPELLEVELAGDGLAMHLSYSLQAEGGQTRLRHIARIDLKSMLLRLASGVIEEGARARMLEDFAALKRRLEA